MNNVILKSIEKEKRELDTWAAKRQKEVAFPEQVSELRNIPYKHDHNARHRMDIYRPKRSVNTADSPEKLPVIVDFHGGGLLMGDKEMNRPFCAWMASQGFLVFNVEYSLVPAVTVYQQFAELSAALDVIDHNLDSYGGDRSRVYLVGDSAGAYLITYTVAMQQNNALAKAAGVRPSWLSIYAVGLLSGMYYTDRPDKIGLFLPKLFYGEHYKKSPFAPYTNPEHPDIVRNLPPCFLVTSRQDHLRRYTLDFAAALRKNHLPHQLVDLPKNKKLIHAFSALYPELEESITVNRQMLDFLLQHGM